VVDEEERILYDSQTSETPKNSGRRISQDARMEEVEQPGNGTKSRYCDRVAFKGHRRRGRWVYRLRMALWILPLKDTFLNFHPQLLIIAARDASFPAVEF
jgi:hypothetical protein